MRTRVRARARAKKRKREVAALTLFILVLLFFSPVSVSGVGHQIYSEASSSDEGIHSFFSDILKEAGNCMDMFIDESPDAENFSSSLELKINLTEAESRFYAAKGVESNVSWVLKPFSSLSGGVKKIAFYQAVFITNYEILKNESDYEAYVRARTAVVKMRTGADEINASLDGIEKIELWNETSNLAFNVSELREKLKDVYALIDYYEKLLEKYELEAPAFEEYLLVVVSNDHPFLYEEITIYIYAKNVTSLSLFIDNVSYKLKNQTEQTKKHRFEEPDEHEIYAEGIIRDGEIIKSDIVKVYVSKIPTFITLSSKYAAFVNERVKITGLLVDYYGELLHANVTIKADDEETELTADRSGYFHFHGTRSSEGVLNITTFYPGNNTYKSSSANISIFFSKFPVSLHIEANKTHINVNETVNFTGSVYGISPNYTVPLIIFVNDTSVKTLTAEKDFNFSLFFSRPEIYEVYTFFPGDSVYKPAKSNVIKITVTEKAEVAGKRVEGIITKFNLLFYLLLILVAIISFFAGLYARTLKRKLHALMEKKRTELKNKAVETPVIEVAVEEVEKEKAQYKEVSEVNILEGVDFEGAYKLLFDTIVDKYGFKKSLTPREILEAIKKKKEPFATMLDGVTELYEKGVYGNVELVAEEREIYFKRIEEILSYFKG